MSFRGSPESLDCQYTHVKRCVETDQRGNKELQADKNTQNDAGSAVVSDGWHKVLFCKEINGTEVIL